MNICVEVLQTAAFLFADEWQEDAEQFSKITNFVKIEFTGESSGYFLIGTTDNIRMIIAENMLGLDSDDPLIIQKKDDAFKEIANILCGHILSFLFGENCFFNILEPFQVSKKDIADIPKEAFYKFIVEDEPFVFYYNLTDDIG
jgi:hypothetical protein